MTGTPLHLTSLGRLVAALGWAYWALALAITLFAVWLPKTWWLKLTPGAAVAAGVVYPVFVRPAHNRVGERQVANEAHTRKLAAVIAKFEMRCKSAGTVQNVDGVVWMKWRTPSWRIAT